MIRMETKTKKETATLVLTSASKFIAAMILFSHLSFKVIISITLQIKY